MDDHPLYSKATERAVIGGLLYDPERTIPVAVDKKCCADWFSDRTLKKAWEVIYELSTSNKHVDVLTVSEAIKLDSNIGSISILLTSCVDECLSVAHIDYYLDILKDKSLKRKIKSVISNHISRLDGKDTADSVLSSLMFDMNVIDSNVITHKSPEEAFENIQRGFKAAQDVGYLSLPSRWYMLQRKTNGYRRGKITVIAARPGVGKSTFMTNEALHLAKKGYKIGIISLEMTEEEIYTKMTCDSADLDSFQIISGEMSQPDMKKFVEAGKQIIRLPIYISDCSMDIKHICNWIRKMKYRMDIDMVFIDYVQLINSKGSHGKRHEVVAQWSHDIANTAKANDVAVGLLSQISRGGEPPHHAAPEDRWKYVPKLFHLKESGALEEDAFQVIILYPNPQEDDVTADTLPYIFSVEKNRSGPIGRIEILFQKNRDKFTRKIQSQQPELLR